MREPKPFFRKQTVTSRSPSRSITPYWRGVNRSRMGRPCTLFFPNPRLEQEAPERVHTRVLQASLQYVFTPVFASLASRHTPSPTLKTRGIDERDLLVVPIAVRGWVTAGRSADQAAGAIVTAHQTASTKGIASPLRTEYFQRIRRKVSFIAIGPVCVVPLAAPRGYGNPNARRDGLLRSALI